MDTLSESFAACLYSIFNLVSRADCLAAFFVAFNVAGMRFGRNNCLSWAFSCSHPFLDDLFANSLDHTRKYWMILIQTSKKLHAGTWTSPLRGQMSVWSMGRNCAFTSYSLILTA